MLYAAIPAFLIYGFLFPLGLFIGLYRARHTIKAKLKALSRGGKARAAGGAAAGVAGVTVAGTKSTWLASALSVMHSPFQVVLRLVGSVLRRLKRMLALQHKFYFYGVVVMIRKAVLIAVLMFLTKHTLTQVSLMAVLYTISVRSELQSVVDF